MLNVATNGFDRIGRARYKLLMDTPRMAIWSHYGTIC